MLREANKSDIQALAKIHLQELRFDFLPSLGEKFLLLLYRNLLENKTVYIYVAEQKSNIQGFIVGSKNFNKVFKNILLKNFIQYVMIIIPQLILKPFLCKNVFETIFYVKKEGEDVPEAELIIICVASRYHHKGIGKKLVFLLEKVFYKKNVKNYKVSTTDKNIIANLFYRSLGFVYHHNFFLYGKKINLYVKQII